jgi:hypothetical protein
VVLAVLVVVSADLAVSADITNLLRGIRRRGYNFGMLRAAALLLGFIAVSLFAQDPNSDPDSFDIEPPLLIPNRGADQLAKPSPSPAQDVDLAKLEKAVERAKRSAAGAERLCKMGALSKVEAEQRELRTIRLEFDLANARLVMAKQAMLEKEKQIETGETQKSSVTQTETDLALAIKIAHEVTAKRDQAELDAAEANVHRQEKLLALGSARERDLNRALQKLAELKAAKD